MEDKKVLYITSIAVVIFLIIVIGIFIFFYLPKSSQPPPVELPKATNASGDVVPFLPIAGDITLTGPTTSSPQSELEKEKQFISSFWQPVEIEYTPAVPGQELTLDGIKEQVVNYRDFSRKIDLDPVLEKLAANNFVVIKNPFDPKIADWESSYKLVKENNLPIFISADALAGLYQDTLHVIYKEIEQEIFYPSLWELLKEMFDQVKGRYEAKRQQFGIETDIVTEANRLELAYLTVALKLLRPEPNQIKESLSADRKFFSAHEAVNYKISVPDYLIDEINQEIKLIDSKAQEAKSPIFLYQKNYQNYAIPAQYRTSEILKNYYLAITWLNESLFPLWSTNNDCPKCLLDEPDHLINFVASLYFSNDLAGNQNLKNRWANIYKSISFFKGLEADLTYLNYQQAAENLFGPDYDLDNLFTADSPAVKEHIAGLQQEISRYVFPVALGGDKDNKEKAGLRLLRNYHLLENKLFNSLTASTTVGQYIGSAKTDQTLPFTACRKKDENSYRCLPTGLDLFNLLGNETAENILSETGNDQYEYYNLSLSDFAGQLNKFDQYTWHDNAYLALLSSLQQLNKKGGDGFPAFMQNEAWAKKSLNTALGAWTEIHREINFEKTTLAESGSLGAYFPYGYVEPQAEFYGQLLSNIKMIMDGFTTLEIISPIGKSFNRLENLKIVLEQALEISKKELENTVLEIDNYNFINGFNKHVQKIIGDIKKENIQNRFEFTYSFGEKNTLKEKIGGLDYIIAVYPDPEGKLFFAIGPVFNYTESVNNKPVSSDWQQEFKE